MGRLTRVFVAAGLCLAIGCEGNELSLQSDAKARVAFLAAQAAMAEEVTPDPPEPDGESPTRAAILPNESSVLSNQVLIDAAQWDDFRKQLQCALMQIDEMQSMVAETKNKVDLLEANIAGKAKPLPPASQEQSPSVETKEEASPPASEWFGPYSRKDDSLIGVTWRKECNGATCTWWFKTNEN